MSALEVVDTLLEAEHIDWSHDPEDPDAPTRAPAVYYYEIYVSSEHAPEDDYDAPRDDGFSTFFASMTPPDCEIRGDCNVGKELQNTLAREALSHRLIEPQDLAHVGYVAPVTRETYLEFERATRGHNES